MFSFENEDFSERSNKLYKMSMFDEGLDPDLFMDDFFDETDDFVCIENTKI